LTSTDKTGGQREASRAHRIAIARRHPEHIQEVMFEVARISQSTLNFIL
jgi:hypothetical protein